MKRRLGFTLALFTAFLVGFALRSFTEIGKEPPLKKVTGIGGIFFKCKDPKQLREWYQQNLGLQTNQYGAVFEWRQGADTTKKGFTQWSPFSEKTSYFQPSPKDFMINYRVDNLNALVEQLRRDHVTILDSIEVVDYGKFVHILDVEGNKVELWEANDEQYEALGRKMGAQTTK